MCRGHAKKRSTVRIVLYVHCTRVTLEILSFSFIHCLSVAIFCWGDCYDV